MTNVTARAGAAIAKVRETKAVRLFRDLEEAILNPPVDVSFDELAGLFHPEYLEMGSTGKVYDKRQVLDMMSGRGRAEPVMIRDLLVKRMAGTAALVTYRSIGVSGQEARRSSVWVFEEGEWLLHFHQGTRIPNTWGDVS